MRVNRGNKDDRSSGRGDDLRSRTDRGNQSDEGIGSSASRGGGGGEGNAPRRADAADLDPIPDTDVIGTTDAMEE
jgi:hypothetical protein